MGWVVDNRKLSVAGVKVPQRKRRENASSPLSHTRALLTKSMTAMALDTCAGEQKWVKWFQIWALLPWLHMFLCLALYIVECFKSQDVARKITTSPAPSLRLCQSHPLSWMATQQIQLTKIDLCMVFQHLCYSLNWDTLKLAAFKSGMF